MREQFNKRFPQRSKSSDGTIGDTAHSSRNSDHNAWIRDAGQGVVSALDITHDPRNGVDVHRIAEHLRLKRDPRIKYVISNRRIFSSVTQPWVWRKYSGSNPHIAHFHVSVHSSKSHYDNDRAWDLFPDELPPIGTADPEQREDTRRLLRLGSQGDDVREVQELLSLPVDGRFGNVTQAAVKAFQRAVGLRPDGIIGPQTYAELDQIENLPTDDKWNMNITATVFGGAADRNRSAYEDRWIDDEEIGVALPFRFQGDRPMIDIVNAANGRRTTAALVDVGPWETRDPYWVESRRPRAESGKDSRGRTTNKAGIDLTPGAAREIGLVGKGVVHWSFAETKDEGESA